MKIIYSIAAKFNGGGIGTTSYNAVRGIYRHQLLKKLYCTSAVTHGFRSKPSSALMRTLGVEKSMSELVCNGTSFVPSEIDSDLIYNTRAAFFDRIPLIPQKYRYCAKDWLHDQIVSLKEDFGADIFHVWNGHGLQSLKKAKKKGLVTFVERASSHINTYERLLKEEYERWGLRINPVLPVVKKRLLEEYELADYINVPSEFAYQSMVENGVPESKLNLLPFGANIEKFKPPKKKRSDFPFTAVFVGQVGFRKGVLYLLEAWKKLGLKKARLYILGEEESAARKFLDEYRDLKTVEFIGYTDPVPYFKKAHVFVFPSIEEGSALVTYEALAAGVPVITTYNSGSVVRDRKDGYIVPICDPDAIAERLEALYQKPPLQKKLAVAARRRAESYPWEGYGERLVKSYEKVS